MQKVLRETCEQYVARRLSEGWRIISQIGFNVILQSPEGILRPVDLRNGVETLRPNDTGDYTNLQGQIPNSTYHWDKVDEVDTDEDSTFVYEYNITQTKDAYNLGASSIPSGSTINSVKVYFRWRLEQAGYTVYAQPFLRLGTNETAGTQLSTTSTTYATNNEILSRPGGGSWTVADLVDLQVAIGLKAGTLYYTCRCTQVYVEVDYTAVTAKTSSDTGSGADAKVTGNPRATLLRTETGSGVDAFKVKGMKRTETGSGVDAKKAYPAVTHSRHETGSGVETLKSRYFTRPESGAGVDAKKAGNPLVSFPVRAETGSGVDILVSLLAAHICSETGSGVEALPSRGFILPETGSGIETVLTRLLATLDVGVGIESYLFGLKDLFAVEAGLGVDIALGFFEKFASDIGTCILENSYLHILEGVKESHETGSGVDTSSLTALFQRVEAGLGAESVVARAIYAKEYPAGAVDLARVITATLTGQETGTGAEASLMSYYQKVTETGAGVDTSTLKAMFTGSDTGAGVEAITLLAAKVSYDTGVGIEKVITYFRKLIDSGVGSEVVQLIGLVGRAMKTQLYTRPYYKTSLYFRPYYKTRLYISETQT